MTPTGCWPAEWKGGKTWLVLDLAVAVASGGAWLGNYPIEIPGPVVVFLGEGRERKMLRCSCGPSAMPRAAVEELRDRGLSTARRVDVAGPGGSRQEVKRTRRSSMVIDPLYLSAAGARVPTCTPWAQCFRHPVRVPGGRGGPCHRDPLEQGGGGPRFAQDDRRGAG